MTIKNEITTLRNRISAVLPELTFKLQQDLKAPTKDVCAIKRMETAFGDELTSKVYSNKYTYRFVIYASSELTAQGYVEKIGSLFANHKKIPIEQEPAWLALGSFSCSESFETDTSGVFAVIGMINAHRYEVKTQEDAKKLQQLYIRKD